MTAAVWTLLLAYLFGSIPAGVLVARTDLGIPAVRLGLEGHGRQFHFGPLQEPLDEQRAGRRQRERFKRHEMQGAIRDDQQVPDS